MKGTSGWLLLTQGDEITIPQPKDVSDGAAAATKLFIPWAKQRGLSPADIGCNCNVDSPPNASNWTGCTYNAR
jgi:hypothetical protein